MFIDYITTPEIYCLQRSSDHYIITNLAISETQAKAGLPDEAFTIFEEMQQPPYLIQPDHMMCNILVNAYSRSLPPRVLAAEQMVYNFMPSQKIIPDRRVPIAL